MAKFDILEDLKWRGAINQETDEEGLKNTFSLSPRRITN